MDSANHLLSVCIVEFEKLKALGDKTFAQLSEEQFHWQPNSETNSVAITVQHLVGNMRSRWTEFFTSDLEKPDRNRDSEFEEQKLSKEQILEGWERGWSYVMETMRSLTPEDLMRTVVIRDQSHTVIEAVLRQISHYAYHIGQIVHIAKELLNTEWKTLSIARGKSTGFTPPPKPQAVV